MSRPDPPGSNHRPDPPGEILPGSVSQLAASQNNPLEIDSIQDEDDSSEQSVPRNDYDEEYDNDGEEENEAQSVKEEDEYYEHAEVSQDGGYVGDIDLTPKDPINDFEPNYSKTNEISFRKLCQKLELLWTNKMRKTNRRSQDERFSLLIDDSLRQYLHGYSWFPMLRLMMPDIDTTRPRTGMKESNIAQAWAEGFDLSPNSQPFKRLKNFNDPTHFGQMSASNLSLAVYEIVGEREISRGSKLNLKQVNDLLDELVEMKGGTTKSNHDWKDGGGSSSQSSQRKKGPSLKQQRKDWVKKLREKKLSAVEHKWIVRILLQKMELGFGSKAILIRWMPDGLAVELYRMNNNLKSVCTTLSNPYWLQRHEAAKRAQEQNHGKVNWMEETKGEAVLGASLAPMFSQRVYFRDALAFICKGHRAHAKKAFKDDVIKRHLLPIKNPAFICEVKLDGERMIIHVNRGIVTMNTRRGRYYSDIYSPALAPSIRRALAKWDVDVILDGEVVAWDNGKQEMIAFGNNRTIALARERWMKKERVLDERDIPIGGLHRGQDDINVARRGYNDRDGSATFLASDCWLRYEVFDILYCGGHQAAELVSLATDVPQDQVATGSIIHLNGFQRKRLLYCLISPQEKECVIVPSLVVRPNGDAVKADEYFSLTNPTMEKMHRASVVDSIEWGLGASDEHIKVYDDMKGGLSDKDVDLKRAMATDRFQIDIVDILALEGIILKDLNASYLLDGRKYWAKHKPDFEADAQLNDIDLVILGAYHGTGMGPSGKLNAFLLGCVDDENPETFIAVSKVTGGSVSWEISEEMLASTGYKKQTETEPWDPGQWFLEQNHGKSIPDFISKRTFQNEEGEPPVFDKKKYPDLWIHPEDSIVLTVKASEITATNGFQAGVTLRFPRVERVRMKGSADEKPAKDVETLEGLHRLYREQMQRRVRSGEVEFHSGSLTPSTVGRRFRTAEEGLKRKINRNTFDQEPVWTMPIAERKESSALEGLTISALEGVYVIDGDTLDGEEAKEQGWFDLAKDIDGRDDILLFISKHGGIPKISVAPDTDFVLGGRADDSRVVMHHKGLEHAAKERGKSRSKVGLSSEGMLKIGGVLKWTYLVSVVHLWRKEIMSFKVESGEDLATILRMSSIKSTHPHFLKPTRHRYLIPAWYRHQEGDEVFGISTSDECTMIDFKRGLQEVASQAKREQAKRSKIDTGTPQHIPWQVNALSVLLPEQRWSIAGPHQKFWPFPKGETPKHATIVYPDLFDLNFGKRIISNALEEVTSGNADRWNEASAPTGAVASCLPLARAMGAHVTPHLHDGVTHVLCELKNGLLMVKWDDFDIDAFVVARRARRMKTRLSGMHEEGCDVTFVSSDWIRSQWRQS